MSRTWNLLAASRLEALAELFSEDRLELTILPTESCNLRCVYCYEEKRPGRMPGAIAEGIKRLIERRAPGLKLLQIGWFGGEPLLAQDIVLDISRFAYALSEKLGSLCFQGGMSTNGVLLTPLVTGELVRCGITAFQVSLDGPEEYHNRMRVHSDGRGSFCETWSNLIALRQTGLPFRVNIRVHLSPENKHLLPGFVEELCRNFGGDSRFRLFFKALAPLGGANDHALTFCSPAEQRSLRARLRDIVHGRLEESEVSQGSYICYAARPTSFVIRSDGSLGKCTVGLSEASNRLGRLLPEGLLQLDAHLMKRWISGTVELDREFMRCPRQQLLAASRLA